MKDYRKGKSNNANTSSHLHYDLVNLIVEGTSSVTGGDFFKVLVKKLSQALQVKYAFIGELNPLDNSITTIAVWGNGEHMDNFNYQLKGTPCEEVIYETQGEICYFPEKIQDLFPEDILLKDMDISSYRGIALKDGEGKGLGLLSVMHDRPMGDVSVAESILRVFKARAGAELERLKTEEKLRENEKLSQSILDSVHPCIAVLDNKGELIYKNKLWTEYSKGTGLPFLNDIDKGEINLLEVLHNIALQKQDDHLFETYECVSDVIKGERLHFSMEYHQQTLQGQSKWLSIRAMPLAGDKEGAVLSLLDITRRKKMEERRNTELAIISELSDYGNINLALRNVLNLISTLTGCQALSIKLKEKGGQPYYVKKGFPDDSVNSLMEKDYCLKSEHKTEALIPIKDEGRDIGMLRLCDNRPELLDEDDISFLELVSIHISFAYRLMVNTQALINSEERLEKINKELEKSNRLKSEFLANMSHELRTPLNSIIGFSELLGNQVFGELNQEQLEYINYIRESGDHLLSLVNDVLDLSKIEANHIELELQEINVYKLLESSLKFFKEKAMNKNIELNLEAQGDLPLIEADERRIKQVLFNLFSNALKFTDEGGKVTLLASYRSGYIEVCVEDTGIGIAPEYHDKIFKEFSQVDGSLSRNHEGTGLGLALSKTLIELHGGSIWLESKPEKGSKFFFNIPVN